MDRSIPITSFPEITILNPNDDIDCSIEIINSADGITKFKFNCHAKNELIPKPISIQWKLPFTNVQGVWKSSSLHEKRIQYDWELEHLQSRVSVDAPVISVFDYEDQNKITFASSDAINLLEMNALHREEDNHLYCFINFFSEPISLEKSYSTEIRVDTRVDITFTQALKDVSMWWESFDNLQPAPVPNLATVPIYSTWYQFHQDLSEKELLSEAKIAKELGYDLMIIDDGWQTLDASRGYDFTGDWQPERFPKMRALVNKLHHLGMKVGIWYSVPFCGKKSKAYQKFKGKFLNENHRWAPVFDPRYPEVRTHLIDLYKSAVLDWDLDALKLDFIDDFKVYPNTPLTKDNGRDYHSVNQAVDRLLSNVYQELRTIKPDIAIEFRQKYIGPAVRKYGNMFRAFDCPGDPITNRIRTTDVKLLCGQSAVHSDMLTWHQEENVEVAALQLLNGFFSVPQMSIHLNSYPADHLEMIRFYNNYWKENRAIICKGHFDAKGPLANYPILQASLNGKSIIGVYDDLIIKIPEENEFDILNAKMTNQIYYLLHGGSYSLQAYNCMGTKTMHENKNLSAGIHQFQVPVAGLLKIRKKS